MEIEGGNSLEDRHINISRFLEARSAEIGHFTHQLNLKRNGSNKLAYQMVRKHLRRRAMSHNRYRIPFRVRARMNVQELDVIEKTQDPVRCRKSLRKPKLLMKSYTRRARNDKWMETHLWHAKRMRMFKYFQYKIAETPNEKGDRACYRFANHECTVYDKSYTELIYLEANNLINPVASTATTTTMSSTEIILNFLSRHVSEQSIRMLKSLASSTIISGGSASRISNSIEVFRSEKSILIGPAQFIWRSAASLIVLIHPGCASEWSVILSEYLAEQAARNPSEPSQFAYHHIKDAYNLFELSGPQTMSKIYSLFRNLSLSDEAIQTLHPLAKHFNVVSDPNNYPRNQVISLNFEAQVSARLVRPPHDFSQVVIDSNQLDQVVLNQALVDIVRFSTAQSKATTMNVAGVARHVEDLSVFDRIKEFSAILEKIHDNKQEEGEEGQSGEKVLDEEEQKKLYLQRFKTVNRSRYTHRKKDKISKKQKITALSNAKATSDAKPSKQQQQTQQSKQNASKIDVEQSNQQQQPEAIASSTEKEENKCIEENVHVRAARAINEKKKQKMEMLIILRNSSSLHEGYGAGVSLLLPSGIGNTIWRLLSFIACKAIGLNEHNSILSEAGQKVFPNDYPLTHAYAQLQKSTLEAAVSAHMRKPIGKRVSYSLINSPFPFRPNFDYLLSACVNSEERIAAQQEDLAEVRVIMAGRGKPAVNAYICVPTKEDIEKYSAVLAIREKHQYQTVDSRVYAIHEEPKNLIEKEVAEKEENAEEKKKKKSKKQAKILAIPEPSDIQTSREIIGFLSQGNFSLKGGIGKGRGYVVKYFLDDLVQVGDEELKAASNNNADWIEVEENNNNTNNDQDVVVTTTTTAVEAAQNHGKEQEKTSALLCLIRNVTSRKYYMAKLYLI